MIKKIYLWCLLYLRWDESGQRERPAGFSVTLSVLLVLCKVAAVTVVGLNGAVIVWRHHQRLVCNVIKKTWSHLSLYFMLEQTDSSERLIKTPITYEFRFNPGSSCNIADHNSKMDHKWNASKCRFSGGTWLLGSVSCVYGSVPVSQFTVRSSTATAHTIIIQKHRKINITKSHQISSIKSKRIKSCNFLSFLFYYRFFCCCIYLLLCCSLTTTTRKTDFIVDDLSVNVIPNKFTMNKTLN